MEYTGRLYGKIGNKYFDTSRTSEDFDCMLNTLIEVISESNRGVSGRLIIDNELETKIITAINKATK